MGVILTNRSIYPTSMMRLFAETAYRLSGCRGDVVVNVGNGSKKGYSGVFIHRNQTKLNGQFRSTHGLIKISPTTTMRNWLKPGDCLEWAISNFKLFLHEFHHCREYQDKIDYGIILPHSFCKSNRLRRDRHDDRPEEIRAHAAEEAYYEAASKLDNWDKIQENLIEFGLILERNSK